MAQILILLVTKLLRNELEVVVGVIILTLHLNSFNIHYQTKMVVGQSLCLLLCLGLAQAFIPPSCTHNVSKPDATCCPIPPGFKTPCGYPSRGICRPTQVYQEPVQRGFSYWFKHDFRMSWPSRVFKYSCECTAQFGQADCGGCWYGYQGSTCQHRTSVTRKNALKMTKKEKRNFWEILVASKRTRSQYLLPTIKPDTWQMSGPWRNVSIHEEIMFRHWFAMFSIITNDPKKCKKYKGKFNFCHSDPLRPLYQRMYLLHWESTLRDLAWEKLKIANFSFPYWDWTDATKCDVCTNDLVGLETKYRNLESGGNFLHYDGPFSCWGAHCSMRYRKPCSYCDREKKLDLLSRRWISNKFPTTADVRRVLKVPLFYDDNQCQSFAHWLAGGKGCFCDKNKVTMDQQLLNMVVGTFHDEVINVNDPLYILHTANIDRLLTRWYARIIPSNHELPTFWGKMPGACRQCTMVPFMPQVTLEDVFVRTEALGYQYDNLDFGKLKSSEVVASIENEFVPPNQKCAKGKNKEKTKEKTKDEIEEMLEEVIDDLRN